MIFNFRNKEKTIARRKRMEHKIPEERYAYMLPNTIFREEEMFPDTANAMLKLEQTYKLILAG
jgi:hypothetical protein